MTRAKINLRNIAKTKLYTVETLAKVLKVTKNSIYWRIHKMDLPVLIIDGVYNIYGEEFVTHEKQRRQQWKFSKKEKLGKVYCCSDHKMITPEGKNVTIQKIGENSARVPEGSILLRGICPICKKNVYMLSNISQIEKYKSLYNVSEIE